MSSIQRPLNLAIIGFGMVSDTHLRAIADLPQKAHLKGIYARSESAAKQFLDKARNLITTVPTLFNNPEDIANDPEIDFVLLLTPPNARFEYVQLFAKAGKHMLCEKPLERTDEAALEIVTVCEKHSVSLGVVFQHRMREASMQLAQFMKQEHFGKLGLVEVVVPWWREQAYYDEPGRGSYERDGGGVLISQAIHTLDVMLSLCGDVTEVQAFCRKTSFHQMESEDFVTAGLDFKNGAVGSLVASTASFPGDAESITLHFSEAVAVLKSGTLKVLWRDGRVEVFGEDASTGGGADPMAFTHEWHRSLIEDFIDSIIAKKQPIATGREALKVHNLISALVRSSDTKQAITLE